jgi:hypothetical protein
MTPLIRASHDNKDEEVKALLKYAANVNAVDNVIRNICVPCTLSLKPLSDIFVCVYVCVC